MGEPVWIRDEVVLAVYARQLAEHGGAAGVRDATLLSSALARLNLAAGAISEAGLGEWIRAHLKPRAS